MAKLVALWTKPTDVEGFEQHYKNKHMAIVERFPGVVSKSVTRLTGAPTGGEPAYYLMFEATVASDDDLNVLLRSEALRESGQDAQEMMERYGTQATLITGSDF